MRYDKEEYINKIRSFIYKHKHLLILLYWFIYLALFNALEKAIPANSQYFITDTWVDKFIPFNEVFVIPYIFWYIYVGAIMTFLAIKDKEEFLTYSYFVFIGMTTCLIICAVFPNGQNLRPTVFERNNVFVKAVKYIYSIDTPTNVLPSMHVFNSIATHIAIIKSKYFSERKYIKISSWIISILIILSTVFIKQHAVLDLVAAIVLVIPFYLVLYKVNLINLIKKDLDNV